ncbi:MAG: penicillin-binding protein [bacterium]|nr:MAG: penicillin-binding protein [bacterium]
MRRRITADESSLKRITVLVILVILFFIIIFLRLFQIQILDRGKYVEMARNQYLYASELKPARGIIYDRKLRYLAINRNTWSLGVDVTKVVDTDSAGYHFSRIFNRNKDYYLEQLHSERTFFWLVRGASEKVVNQIEDLKIPGVYVIKEPKRYYPQNRLAAQLIGFTDIDLNGLSGIELAKNHALQGSHGLAVYQKDAYGNTVTDLNYPAKQPQKGKDVVLTIDNTYQWIAEEETQYVVDTYDADAATVIITNPMTGEILAMAVKPGFDPNNAGRYSPGSWRNRAITDSYEPGSTFKPIIMSAVLEEGLKSPNDLIYCENGKYDIYDRTIEDVKGYGWLTLAKVIKKSSNIGMAKIAKEIDKNIIYQYVRDFGFGVKTGIELPGETSGELKKTIEWSKFTSLAMSYGYEISVTPIQMAMAFGAIANGGFLLKPKIYLCISNELAKEIEKVQPEVIQRVLSDSTSKMIVRMLEDVVLDGTGRRAFVEGLRIAGKTGTAKKYDPRLKSYTDNNFISSFIGFFPAESPQVLVYVMVDNPKKAYLGGEVAAPTFKRILQRIFRIIEIEKQYVALTESNDDNSNYIHVPNLVNKKVQVAEEIIEKLGLKFIIENEGDLIFDQNPVPGTKVEPGTDIIVKVKDFNGNNGNNGNNGKYTSVPSVVGLSLRDALSKMSREGLRVVVQGNGRVIKQIPEPGKRIRIGARCVVQCEPVVDLAEFRSR